MHAVRGLAYDKEGFPRLRIGGWWNRELWVESVEPINNPGCPQIAAARDVRFTGRTANSSSSGGETSSSLQNGLTSSSETDYDGLAWRSRDNNDNNRMSSNEQPSTIGPYHTRDASEFKGKAHSH